MLHPTLPITKRLLTDTARFNFYGDSPFALEIAQEIERRNNALISVVFMLQNGINQEDIIKLCKDAIAGA
jgi:hypothetical protein